MIKYSFIVPVYNTSRYLRKCLDSLVNQTYKNYEIVVINDGSTDDSKKIISEYKKKYENINLVNQKNSGLSEARNTGVANAKGKYILFVDSDDYVEKNLLKMIDEELKDEEIIRYQVITEDEYGNNKREWVEDEFDTTTGYKAFKMLSNYHFVEPAWCYTINKKYYVDNKFKFKKGIYHEDYALMPYVIYKSEKIKSISYLGYHYITRQGSIINNDDYDKTLKKAYDMLSGYKDLRTLSKNITEDNNYDDYYLSFLANSAIIKAKELKPKDRKEYVKELKKMKAYDDVLVDTKVRKLKKVLLKLSINLYLKVIK